MQFYLKSARSLCLKFFLLLISQSGCSHRIDSFSLYFDPGGHITEISYAEITIAGFPYDIITTFDLQAEYRSLVGASAV